MSRTVKEETSLCQIQVMDQVEPQSMLCHCYKMRSAATLGVRWTAKRRLPADKAKAVSLLMLTATLAFTGSGCSISLTRNTYYSQTDQAGSETTKEALKQSPNTETKMDETAD